MESVHRNVILDLLPVYHSGQASEETRALIEEYARGDAEIARMIRGADFNPAATSKVRPEPKVSTRARPGIRRQLMYVALTIAAILTIPLIGQFPWSGGDFVAMGTLLFGAGLAYVLIARRSDNPAYRIGVAVAVVSGLLLVWVNLAVGISGSEDNPANALYGAVLVIGFVGAVVARFRAQGLSRSLLVMAIAQFFVPVIAMFLWRPTLDEPPGIVGVFLLNTVFAALFAVSSLMFRRARTAEL
jgi:hypothetical protein